MEKINAIEAKFVDEIPDKPEQGFIYISEKYEVAVHLCACGCGEKTVTPLGPGEWSITKNEYKVTLRPSIGNWAGQNPYHAHYFITENKIEWL